MSLSSASRELKERLEEKAWRAFRLFQGTDFYELPCNKARIELRTLLAELCDSLKCIFSRQTNPNHGTCDVLTTIKQLADPVRMNDLRNHVVLAKKLDARVEHDNTPINDNEWENGARNLHGFATFVNIPHLSNLIDDLIQMKNANEDRNEFLVHIWLQCQHLNNTLGQRQAIVNFFINIAGDDVRQKGALIFPFLDNFMRGDKEAFKSFHLVEPYLVRNVVQNWRERNRTTVDLRGRTRHLHQTNSNIHPNSCLENYQIKKELEILLRHGALIGDLKISNIFLEAWYIYADC